MAIVQRISIEGGDAVVKQLQDVGKQGQQALQGIQEAAKKVDVDKLNQSFKTVGDTAKSAFGSITEAGGKLASLFGITLTAGIGALNASLLGLAKSAVGAVGAMGGLSKATGTTVEQMGAILSVFKGSGVDADAFGDKMKRLSINTQKAWEEIKTSVKNADNVQQQNRLNVEGSALAVEQANINLAKSYKEVSAAAGDPAKMEQALLNVRQNQLNVQKSELAASEARQKQYEDEANSIANLRGAVLNLAQGRVDLSNINATAENMFKGIVAAAGPSVEALKDFRGGITSIASTTAPEASKVLYLMADVFKNLDDNTLKAGIAAHAFGREVDTGLIKALSQGSEAFKKRQQELKDLGLSFDEADAKAASAFKQSFRELGEYMDLLKNRIGISFAPIFTNLAQALTEAFKNNIGTIKGFFEDIRATAVPIFQGLTNAVKGVSFADFKKAAKDAFTPDQYIQIEVWQQRFLIIKEGVMVVVNAFKGLRTAAVAVLDEIAAIINKLFGTKVLSGDTLGVAILVARFTGLIGIINGVTASVYNLGKALVALTNISLANPWVLLAVAVALVVILIINHWDEIKAAGKAAADYVKGAWDNFANNFKALIDGLGKAWDYYWNLTKQKFSDFGNWIQGWITTIKGYWADFWNTVGQYVDDASNYIQGKWNDLAQVWQSIVSKMQGYWSDFVAWVQQTAAAIGAKIKAIGDALSSAQQQSNAAQGQAGTPAGAPMASGGLVRGPGSSTSDSILARLSRGEFVVRAAAVRSVGVGFMRALNAAPGYALGGLVDAVRDGLASIAVPLARGGPAPSTAGLRPFNLVMPGGGTYGGLFAQESAVTTLRRASINAQVSAAGRRPAWVR